MLFSCGVKFFFNVFYISLFWHAVQKTLNCCFFCKRSCPLTCVFEFTKYVIKSMKRATSVGKRMRRGNVNEGEFQIKISRNVNERSDNTFKKWLGCTQLGTRLHAKVRPVSEQENKDSRRKRGAFFRFRFSVLSGRYQVRKPNTFEA